MLFGGQLAIRFEAAGEEPIEQVSARGRRERGGGIGQGGIGPDAQQAGFGFTEDAVDEMEFGDRAAFERSAQDDLFFGFDGAVEAAAARPQSRQDQRAAVEIQHHAGLVARAVVGGDELVPGSGLKPAGIGGAGFDGCPVVSNQPEADLAGVDVGHPPAVAVLRVLLPGDGIVTVRLRIQEANTDGERLLGLGLGALVESLAARRVAA